MDAKTLELANIYQILYVALVSLLGFIFWKSMYDSILGGGLLMAINFWFLRYIVQKILCSSQRSKWIFFLILKMLGVFILFALMIISLKCDPFGLFIGISGLFLGLCLAFLHVYVKSLNLHQNTFG